MEIKKNKYQFFMQECDSQWNPIEGTKRNLEEYFEGLRYLKAEGLLAVGKTRVYTEKYADSDGLRVYIAPTHDTTNITLSLCFFGENRQSVYRSFLEYCMGKKMLYWDTARNTLVKVYIENEVKPAKEEWYTGIPYLSVNIQMVNATGTSKTI